MSSTSDTPTTATTDHLTVLMTGAGAPGASGIIRSLRSVEERSVRIVGVDMDPQAYGFALVDTKYTVPPGTDNEYVDRMLTIAQAEAADVVLPLTTAELQPLAEHADEFEASVMVSGPKALAVANDKGELYSFLAEEGFRSAPAYERVASKEAFRSAVTQFGYPDQPVCFKPPVASGMRGFRVLDNGRDRLSHLLEEKPDSAVTTLEEVLPVLESADTFPELTVMEYLPGSEYSVDVLALGDSVGAVIPRSRARTRAGISFEGVVERREDLIEEAASICRSLGLEYNINLQFKHDPDGVPKIIEINPRVSGTIVMCVGAGANLPYLGVKHAIGEEVQKPNVAWGTRMVRYWQELFRSPDGEPYHLDRGRRETVSSS